MITLVVDILGLLLIVLITWWLFAAKPKAKVIANNRVDILVHHGVYEPAVIIAKAGQPLHLRFMRQDENPACERVIFSQFNINAKLPLNQACLIILTPTQAGEYDFSSQTGQCCGKLIVE